MIDGLEVVRACRAFVMCRVCRHVFNCTRPDDVKGFTCKHVLLVGRLLGKWSSGSINKRHVSLDDDPYDLHSPAPNYTLR